MSEEKDSKDGFSGYALLSDETTCLTTADISEIDSGFGSLVTPIHRASTVVFPTVEAYRNRHKDVLTGYSYGLYGTPTTRELEIRISKLEQAERTLLTPSGMAAVALVTLTEAKPGKVVLFPDTVYEAVRHFASTILDRMNIRTVFYDPLIAAGIEGILSEQVVLVWVESPGSLTFEIQDVAAIAKVAHDRGIKVAADNTWATALRFKPLKQRVDYCVNSLSKYISGHSDVVMGAISVKDEQLYVGLRHTARGLGYGVTADAASLVLRGIETLAPRLDRSEASALYLANWLSGQPYVKDVLHPAMESHPGHDVWKRDFSGSTGLFSIVLAPEVSRLIPQTIESLSIFKLGASWGGTHSVISVFDPPLTRTVVPWTKKGVIVRLSIGLENVEDLKRDLDQALGTLARLL